MKALIEFWDQDNEYGEWKLKKEYNNENSDDINLWPFIKCKELKEFDQSFGLASKQGVRIHIVDPVFQPTYRQMRSQISGDVLAIVNYGKSSAEGIYFDVQSILLKKRSEKSSCKNYKNENDFTECLENVFREKLLNLIGCVPPWIPRYGNEKICVQDVIYKDKYEATYVKSQLNMLAEAIMTRKGNLNLEEECKIPCNEIKLEIVKTSEGAVNWDKNWMQINFLDTVKILEEESNYDELDLIVEIGSSLGLWIGLSALGILDLVYKKMKILYSNVFH